MKARYIGFVTAMAATLVACGKVEFSKIKGPECQGFDKECITQDGIDYFDYHVRTKEQNFKTDILFVDDNSGSMRPEQEQMAFRFPTFLSSISNLDWRIAITTTDMNGAGPTQDGQILKFTGSVADYFITPGMANVNNLFTDTIKRTETGWGDERGVYAAIRALQRRAERGFIRDGAHLAVVILSDEDERSDGGHMNPPQGGPLEAGKDNAQDLIDYVNSTWNYEKSLTVHSVIIKPGDTACFNEQQGQPGATAHYGTVYSTLSGLTGGVHGNICASDYGSQLSQIGTVIQQTTSSITLACVPLAGTLQVTPVTGWTQNADKINFNPPLAPGTDVHLTYQCESRT